MSTRSNDENTAPIARSSRPTRAGRSVLKEVGNDSTRAEKRPRASRSRATTASKAMSARRPALGEISNKQYIKKNDGKEPETKRAKVAHASTSSVSIVTREDKFLDQKEKATKLGHKKPFKDITRREVPEEHDVDSALKEEKYVWQYAYDVAQYHLEAEKERKPSSSYMSRQQDINSRMRGILVDWLVDVHAKYNLKPLTLHIAVPLLDQYLEKNLDVARDRLQLVGIAAMFIASKYEEIYPPESDDYVRITDNAYSRDELFEMEKNVLASISFRVSFPTSYHFVQRFLKASRTEKEQVKHMAHYIVDRSLQNYRMLRFMPSMIAASAVHIAKSQLEEPAWDATLEFHSTYSEKDLKECLRCLREILLPDPTKSSKSSSQLSAVARKFAKTKYRSVSKHKFAFASL